MSKGELWNRCRQAAHEGIPSTKPTLNLFSNQPHTCAPTMPAVLAARQLQTVRPVDHPFIVACPVAYLKSWLPYDLPLMEMPRSRISLLVSVPVLSEKT